MNTAGDQSIPGMQHASLSKGIVASYVSSGWSALLGLAFVPLYVGYLGVEAYGLIGFFATLSVWISILDMGLGATLSREVSMYVAGRRELQRLRDLLRSMEVIYGVTAVSIAGVFAATSHVIAAHWLRPSSLPGPTVSTSIFIMGILIAVQWLGTLYRGAVLGLQHQVWLSTVTAIGATARSFGCLLVLTWSPTIIAFFSFQILVSAAETIATGRHLHRHLPQPAGRSKFSMKAIAQIAHFAGGLSLISLSAVLLTQLDKVLLSRLLPLNQFGHFALITTIAGAISLFVTPLHNVAYPRLSGIASSGDTQALSMEYHRFAQILSIGILPVALMLVFFAEEVVGVWMGDSEIAQELAPVLSVWALGTLLNCLTHVPHIAQVAHGWTKLGVVMSLVMVSVSAPLLMLLVPHYGAMAAAWIWVAVNAGYLMFAIPIMHSQILRGEEWSWYTRDVLAPIIGGTLAIVLVRMLLPSADRIHTALYLLIAGVLVFSAVLITTRLGRQAVISFVHWFRR